MQESLQELQSFMHSHKAAFRTLDELGQRLGLVESTIEDGVSCTTSTEDVQLRLSQILQPASVSHLASNTIAAIKRALDQLRESSVTQAELSHRCDQLSSEFTRLHEEHVLNSGKQV
jgi:hypothetical protein